MAKNLLRLAAVALFCVAAGNAHAVVNAPVNIAYPISLGSHNDYVQFSFNTTCPGGQNTVKWVLDGTTIGYAEFYDNFNAEFLHKTGTGWHKFEVYSTCGQDDLKFFTN